METLVAVAHHRNHRYHASKGSHGSTKFCVSSPPSGSFRGVNCRTFHSGGGLPSAPFKACSTKTPVSKKAFCYSSSTSETPWPSLDEISIMSGRITHTSSIPIPMAIKFESAEDGLHFSELWAGPAYSNSPPPSSLPIPKFSLRPKRTVSLDLPTVTSEIDLPPFSKSAPVSPRECSPSASDLLDIADSATKTLCRMLNLDIGDE